MVPRAETLRRSPLCLSSHFGEILGQLIFSGTARHKCSHATSCGTFNVSDSTRAGTAKIAAMLDICLQTVRRGRTMGMQNNSFARFWDKLLQLIARRRTEDTAVDLNLRSYPRQSTGAPCIMLRRERRIPGVGDTTVPGGQRRQRGQRGEGNVFPCQTRSHKNILGGFNERGHTHRLRPDHRPGWKVARQCLSLDLSFATLPYLESQQPC